MFRSARMNGFHDEWLYFVASRCNCIHMDRSRGCRLVGGTKFLEKGGMFFSEMILLLVDFHGTMKSKSSRPIQYRNIKMARKRSSRLYVAKPMCAVEIPKSNDKCRGFL